MGASASVHSVYYDAAKWFKEYFDSDLYKRDFELIDKDHDGGISYSELLRWVKDKADHEGGSWKVFLANPEVIQFAHVQASSLFRRHETVIKKKVVGIDDFRTFLVQFFAISTLWVHFKNADDFSLSHDMGNMKLSFEEFKLAVKTLTASHANESISEEQLLNDFRDLDKDNSNSLAFVEVCAHCCKYIDPTFDPKVSENSSENEQQGSDTNLPSSIAQLQELENKEKQTQFNFLEDVPELEISPDILAELEEVTDNKVNARFRTVASKNLLAVDALQAELDKQKSIAKLEEVKFVTESAMDDLLHRL